MEQNQNNLFRQKSLEKAESVENSTSFMRVVNPGILVLLAAILLAVAGLFVWIFFGTVNSKVEVVFSSEGGKAELYVSEDRIGNIVRGNDIEIEGTAGKVMRVSSTGRRAGEVMDDYTIHLNGYTPDTWIYQVRTNITVGSGIHKAEIFKEKISPVQMIIGK